MDLTWIGVGCLKPMLVHASTICGITPRSENAMVEPVGVMEGPFLWSSSWAWAVDVAASLEAGDEELSLSLSLSEPVTPSSEPARFTWSASS